MNKHEFLKTIDEALDKVSDNERREILYDYEEHFRIGREKGKTEEEISLELGNPIEIAKNYAPNALATVKTREFSEENKVRNKKAMDPVSKILLGTFSVVAGVLILCFVSFSALTHFGDKVVHESANEVNVNGMQIDESGIHGDGVSIDENGINVPGVQINDDGISTSNVKIDSNGITAPGVKVDENGITAPGVKIDSNGISVPGITIDKNGVKVN